MTRVSYRRAELKRKAIEWSALAQHHRAMGDIAEAEKWEDAARAAEEIIQRQANQARGCGGDADHMRKMRKAAGYKERTENIG